MEVFYFDEAGFSLKPVVPYAWQPIGQSVELPADKRDRLNVLGFLSPTNQSFFHRVEHTVTSQTVIEAFDRFCAQCPDTRLRLVFLDNASIHHTPEFIAKQDQWLASGVMVGYLPPYCPELNLIERLWHHIKHLWLPLGVYTSMATLRSALNEILGQVGLKYHINFG